MGKLKYMDIAIDTCSYIISAPLVNKYMILA